jgi:C1A family cysteine protease
MAAPIQLPKPGAAPQAAGFIPRPSTRFGLIALQETGEIVGTGWVPDVPDLRDHTEEFPEISRMAEKLRITKVKKLAGPLTGPLPIKVDLRAWCSEIANQGNLGSCTAHAGVGIVEYLENRAFGKHLDGSRLFVYKTTRELLGWVGDTGAYLRSTMAALVYFGVPPEQFWPYTTVTQPGQAGARTFDTEPSTFVYEVADNYEAKRYFCHDPYGRTTDPNVILNSVKTWLAAGFPSMFGFWVFPSYTRGDVKGSFPFPGAREQAIGGHAVDAVGYDDTLKIKNLASGTETTGAFLIRNSWGPAWGDKGFGWLPYDYVKAQFAEDFWTLTGMDWVESGQFGL